MVYQLCLTQGSSFDIYTTRAPSRGVGNGLGARASVALLDKYRAMLYSSGDLTKALGIGEPNDDPSPDVQLLAAWLDGGEHGLFACGDGLATSLVGSAVGTAFLRDYLGGDLAASDLRPYVGSQYSPGVAAVTGNPVFWLSNRWLAFGGCPTVRTFDAVLPYGSGARIAEFTDQSGNPGGYPYAAALINDLAGSGSRCEYLPYELARVQTDPAAPDQHSYVTANTAVLSDVLGSLGNFLVADCIGDAPDTPPAPRFGAQAYPNPFNPKVRIDYTITHAGRLTVKIFDLRGRLVRTILDDHVTAAGSLDWDGTDARGAAAASGVYFYEVRMDNEVEVGKLALIR